jgi:hypothetical protein
MGNTHTNIYIVKEINHVGDLNINGRIILK